MNDHATNIITRKILTLLAISYGNDYSIPTVLGDEIKKYVNTDVNNVTLGNSLIDDVYYAIDADKDFIAKRKFDKRLQEMVYRVGEYTAPVIPTCRGVLHGLSDIEVLSLYVTLSIKANHKSQTSEFVQLLDAKREKSLVREGPMTVRALNVPFVLGSLLLEKHSRSVEINDGYSSYHVEKLVIEINELITKILFGDSEVATIDIIRICDSIGKRLTVIGA